MLTFEQAREQVIGQVSKIKRPPPTINLSVWDAAGYVLAQALIADRNYPPFNRATRDGYAVRASESLAGATLTCIGEIKAGDALKRLLKNETCVQITTGRRGPPHAAAVEMIEYPSRDKELIHFQQSETRGQNI